MFDSPQKRNALIFTGIGVLLLNATRLRYSLTGVPDIVMIGIGLLPVLGVVFLSLGIYRLVRIKN